MLSYIILLFLTFSCTYTSEENHKNHEYCNYVEEDLPKNIFATKTAYHAMKANRRPSRLDADLEDEG